MAQISDEGGLVLLEMSFIRLEYEKISREKPTAFHEEGGPFRVV